jgi:hypothetical protein
MLRIRRTAAISKEQQLAARSKAVLDEIQGQRERFVDNRAGGFEDLPMFC